MRYGRCITATMLAAVITSACSSSSASSPAAMQQQGHTPVPCDAPRDSLIRHVISRKSIKLDYVELRLDLNEFRGDTISIRPRLNEHGVAIEILPAPSPEAEVEVRFNRDACPHTDGPLFIMAPDTTRKAKRPFPWVAGKWYKAEFLAREVVQPSPEEVGVRASGFVILSN